MNFVFNTDARPVLYVSGFAIIKWLNKLFKFLRAALRRSIIISWSFMYFTCKGIGVLRPTSALLFDI